MWETAISLGEMLMQKKTCYRCRALKWLSGTEPECQLGHAIDIDGPAPLEPCEKPLTYLALIEARQEAAGNP